MLLAALACESPQPTSSLPPPPAISEAALTEELQLTGLRFVHLRLWLDEVERYFEGVECWLLVPEPQDATDCEFD